MFEIIGMEDKSYIRSDDNKTIFRHNIYYTFTDGAVEGLACGVVMVSDETMANFHDIPTVGLKCFLTIKSEKKGRGADSYVSSTLVDCYALPTGK